MTITHYVFALQYISINVFPTSSEPNTAVSVDVKWTNSEMLKQLYQSLNHLSSKQKAEHSTLIRYHDSPFPDSPSVTTTVV